MIVRLFGLVAAGCDQKSNIFAIPSWHEYLNSVPNANGGCDIVIGNLNDILHILAAIVDIALRLSALLAMAFIIFGGIKFIVSQGDPQGIASARDTIINAVIGLIITLLAITVVTIIAGKFSS